MNPLLNIALAAARSAGKIIAHACDRLDTVKVDEKTKNDFVTEIDRKSEQEIIYHIHKAYPNHGILAEESGEQKGDDFVWIIDPLDGTTNFIHGIPHFAISIGIKHKNRMEHGLVYDPIRDEIFTASNGQGAYLNNRRIRVGKCEKLETALLATGLTFRNRKFLTPYLNIFEKFMHEANDIRRAGSAALDLAYVAAGRLDGYWEFQLAPWDLAAGTLLVKEAGGFASDFDGKNNYTENGHIVAANPKLFSTILKIINDIYPSC